MRYPNFKIAVLGRGGHWIGYPLDWINWIGLDRIGSQFLDLENDPSFFDREILHKNGPFSPKITQVKAKIMFFSQFVNKKGI